MLTSPDAMAPMKKSGLPRYVVQDAHRDGRARLFYREPGKPKVTLPTPYNSKAFWDAYSNARAGSAIIAPPTPAKGAGGAAIAGTLRALVNAYYERAPDFIGRDALTQADKKGVLESVLAEPIAPESELRFATCPVESFTSRHGVVLRDRKAKLPSAANKRLRYLGLLFNWAIETEMATTNPIKGIKKLEVPRKGHHSWTPEEVRQYEGFHAIGTKARLALAILAFTGIRVSDLCQIGRQHAKNGWLEKPQHKNRKRAPKMIAVPILPDLQAIIDRSPTGDLTYLVREDGFPFTIKGMANKIKDWCRAAKLPHCSAHGVRKAGATVAAENGATEAQLMAIFGWDDAKQATNYTRTARRRKLAKAGMHLMIPGGD